MKTAKFSAFLAFALVVAAGCASKPPKEAAQLKPMQTAVELEPLSKIESSNGYAFVSKIKSEEPIVAVLLDIDCTMEHLVFRYSCGAFRATASGRVRFARLCDTQTFSTIGEIVRAIAQRNTAGNQIGIFMALDGTTLTFVTEQIDEARMNIIADIDNRLKSAGLSFAFLVPDAWVQ